MGTRQVEGVRRFPPNPWLTLSLLMAMLLTAWIQPHDGSLALLVLGATTLLSARFRIGPAALIVLFAVGLELRYAQFGVGWSDVPTAIKDAIDEVGRGLNPYDPGALATRPPFPYGPLALIWYAPLNDPRIQEFGVSVLLLGVLAFRGQPLGLALWAAAPLTVNLASDGSNDHTAGLLLLVALVVLERFPRGGALLVGIAAGFKVYALAWLPPILVWAGVGALAAGIIGTAAVWLPAALIWGPGNILATFQAAEAVHKTPYYSLGETMAQAHIVYPREVLDLFRLAMGALTAVIVSPMVRSHAGVVVGGAAIYLATLYLGFWSTPAYLIPLALVLCWYIDNWLGPDNARIAWPTDPVGTMTAEVDARWPRVDATRIAGQ